MLQDFFKSPGATDSLRVTLTPKSAKAKTPAAAATQEAAPASAAKSVPRTAGRSRLSQVGGAQPGNEQEDADLERTQEVAVLAEVLQAAAAVSSAKKQPPSASRRRSLSRTPGTKIVIVERGMQTTPTPGPASAKRTAAASQASGSGSAGGAALLVRARQFDGCADLSKQVSAKRRAHKCCLPACSRLSQAGQQGTSRLLSTIAVQTEAEDAGDDVEQEQWAEGGSDDGSLDVEGEHSTPRRWKLCHRRLHGRHWMRIEAGSLLLASHLAASPLPAACRGGGAGGGAAQAVPARGEWCWGTG